MKKCCICAHKSRTEIDQEIIRGTSLRTIAKQFGATKSSLYDHQKAGHISASVAKAEEARQIANGEDLLKWTKGLLSKSISYMNKAETAGDLRTAISAIREARGCVELLGQVTGELECQKPDCRPSKCRRPDYYNVPGVAGSHAYFIETSRNPC